MATTAELLIKADSSQVRKAESDLKGFSRTAGRTQASTSKLASTVSKFGKAFGLAAVALGSAAFFKASKDIAVFNQKLADLSAITGASGKDLKFYSDQAKEIGRTTSLSASQAVEAFKLIGSAKPDLLSSAEALNEVTRQAVILAEASGVELPQAAKTLGSALNQFGLDADKAGEVINVLAASAKFGAAEIPAVAEALRNAGSAANALGLDLPETVAGIQALAIAGRQGADAGTGLRQVLLKLEKTADRDLQPSIVGLSEALNTLKARNLSNTELMTLFGEEAFAVATALLSQSDNLSTLNVNLRNTETATEQARIKMDTLKGDTLALGSAIEGLSISLGEKLEPSLRGATQFLTEFINKVQKLVSGGDSIPDLISEIERLDNALANSRFFGRSGAAKKSGMEARLEAANKQLIILKAGAGDAASASLRLVELNEQLDLLLAQPRRMGRSGKAKSDQIAEIRKEILALQETLRGSINVTEIIPPSKPPPPPPPFAPSNGSALNPLGDILRPNYDEELTQVDLIKQRYDELVSISDGLNNSLRTPVEIYNDEIELLNELKNTRINGSDEALLSYENYERGVMAAQDRLSNATKETADEITTFWEEAAENIQNIMADNLFDFMQGEFEFTTDSFKKMLDKMVANALAADIAGALFGSVGANGGSGGGGLLSDLAGGLFSKLGEGDTDSFGGGFAPQSASTDFFGGLADMFSFAGGGYTGEGSRSGGLDGKGGFMAMMHPNETVIDHTKGGGGSVNININVSGVKDEGTLKQTAAQIAQRAGSAAQRAQARNG